MIEPSCPGLRRSFGPNQNLSAERYLKRSQNKRWLDLHRNKKVENQQEGTNQKDLQFAKDLFAVWDSDGNGSISENEIVRPLVSLGLAPDAKFAIKICRSLEPKNSNRKPGEPIELQIEDFLNIFKSDKVSDQLMEIVKRETKSRLSGACIQEKNISNFQILSSNGSSPTSLPTAL